MFKIAIATPAVWAGPDQLNYYISHVAKLVDQINHLSNSPDVPYHIEGVVLEIQNASPEDFVPHPTAIQIRYLRNTVAVRKEKGMAAWWFSNVRSAFEILKADGVLYLPIDMNWENTAGNTVSDPALLSGMIGTLLRDESSLVIGNYECSNSDKEFIEKTVYYLLIERYPDHDRAVTRVRSEFWAITARSFERLMRAADYAGVADPTLFMLVEIMRRKIDINVQPYELGRYKVFDEYDAAKKQLQIERAKKLIL